MWSYRLDQGEERMVQTSGGGFQRRIAIRGLARSPHTLVTVAQKSSRTLAVLGVSTYDQPSYGLGFGHMAAAGMRASNYLPGATLPNLALWSGAQEGASTGFGFPTQPHLAIIALSINDCQYALSTTTYARALNALIEQFRLGRPNCSILLLASANPVAGITAPFANAAQYPMYVDTMRQVAQASGSAFVSIHNKWPDPLGSGFVTPTNPHPTNAGHADMAATLASILLPAG